jgi:hypothetical protein
MDIYNSPRLQKAVENAERISKLMPPPHVLESLENAQKLMPPPHIMDVLGKLNAVFNSFGKAIFEGIQTMVNSDFFKGVEHAAHMKRLSAVGYPPCVLLKDESLEKIKEILGVLEENNAISEEQRVAVNDIIFEAHDKETIMAMREAWKLCENIDKSRLPALSEALEAYNDGKYYSCVAILVCQAEGILRDNEAHISRCSKADSDRDLRAKYENLLKEQQEEAEANNPSEKPNLNTPKARSERQLYLNFTFIHTSFAEYISAYLFGNINNDSDKRLLTHANRNKICHGVDVAFGTQEKALKTILCVDALIRLIFLNELEEDIDNE